MEVSALRQCKVSFSPVGKKEQFVAVSRDSVALSPTHCELCHPRLPETRVLGHYLCLCCSHYGDLLGLRCPRALPRSPLSIHPYLFPSSCCVSSFNHFLLPYIPSSPCPFQPFPQCVGSELIAFFTPSFLPLLIPTPPSPLILFLLIVPSLQILLFLITDIVLFLILPTPNTLTSLTFICPFPTSLRFFPSASTLLFIITDSVFSFLLLFPLF